MRREIAKKWVKALRSGKYKQGRSNLKQFNQKGEPRHCCLGVLCELYNDTMRKNHKKTLNTQTQEFYDSFDNAGGLRGIVTFNGKDSSLPVEVKNWAGISDPLGLGTFYDDNEEPQCLADLNDIGKKFSTIANVIEENIDNI